MAESWWYGVEINKNEGYIIGIMVSCFKLPKSSVLYSIARRQQLK